MLRAMITCVALLILGAPVLAAESATQNGAPDAASANRAAEDTTQPARVRLTTTAGAITLELDRRHSPITVANFLQYVDAGHYDGTIFHRVIPGFMIQGGGYDTSLGEKETGEPIRNEAGNGLTNATGTIAMARTADPDSATAQFFINTVDNTYLDRSDRSMGYTVFGRVIDGMEVVTSIEMSPTHNVGEFNDVPVTPIVIQRAERVERASR